MTRPRAMLLAATLVASTTAAAVLPLRPDGEFAGAEIRALEADDLANPGMLWVDRGRVLWQTAPGTGQPACGTCHGDTGASMRGVAARHPRVDPASARIFNLAATIDACRVQRQGLSTLGEDAPDLLSLTSFVAFQSRGLPIAVSIDGPAAAPFAAGRRYYTTRRGQMNLSCAHCHDDHWGQRLLGETISQGHGNGYPAYRLEWQALGSLRHRIRNCLSGLRAEMPPAASPLWLELELFLAGRGRGVPLAAPGVRR